MAYLVLARKHRPQTYEEVLGQKHVTRTLQNAIRSGRVAHAMLFSGPRGTGKTTIARILAKAMNCETGPTPTPCNTCQSCVEITAGSSVDVFEIDGASNNSVDQVRDLRDNSRYMPAHSRYKIYIIDEVHMLSIAAFNALLKTLEEPPAHVMFLFATTEAHKIPITILSRCQRHDLKRIDHATMIGLMETICHKEAVSVAADNLRDIARESGGSMRDALSLLDQILACTNGQVDAEYVRNLLGSMDRQVLFDLSEAVLARDISRILSVIDTVYQSGQEMKRFYSDVLIHFRHLMLIKLQARPETLTDLSSDEIEILAGQIKAVSPAYLDQVFTLMVKAESDIRHASQPRLAMEMVFFKILHITPALPIDWLIERLDTLLHDPSRGPVTGVVEEQSSYGDTATQLPVDKPVQSDIADDQQVAGHLPSDQRPQDIDPDPGHTDRGGDDRWRRIIAVIAETKPSIAAALSRSELISVSEKAFTVTVHDNEYTTNLVQKNLSMIQAVCREHAGRELQIDFSDDGEGLPRPTVARQKAANVERQLLNHPLVADAVEIFNGTIEEIKIR